MGSEGGWFEGEAKLKVLMGFVDEEPVGLSA
jgi:hypothetical protein